MPSTNPIRKIVQFTPVYEKITRESLSQLNSRINDLYRNIRQFKYILLQQKPMLMDLKLATLNQIQANRIQMELWEKESNEINDDDIESVDENKIIEHENSRKEYMKCIEDFNEKLSKMNDEMKNRKTVVALLCIHLAMIVDRIKNTWKKTNEFSLNKKYIILGMCFMTSSAVVISKIYSDENKVAKSMGDIL